MRLDVSGATIEYDLLGRPDPTVRDDRADRTLLLLHAFPLHRGMWDGLAEALAADEALDLSVLRLDCRGFGGSPAGREPLLMEQIADDAVAVMRHEGIDRAVVCGLSMGGYAALAFARRHPERLAGLILADTRAEADTPEARDGRARTAVRVRDEGTGFLADELVPRLLGETTRRERPDVVARVRTMIAQAGSVGVAQALEGMALRPDSGPFLEDIAVPTLVVCGAEDELTPVSAAETLRDGIPGARLEVLPGAGHLANLETPEAFQAALAAFLG